VGKDTEGFVDNDSNGPASTQRGVPSKYLYVESGGSITKYISPDMTSSPVLDYSLTLSISEDKSPTQIPILNFTSRVS